MKIMVYNKTDKKIDTRRMNMERKTISAFLAVLRKANGMTQRDLAALIGVTPQAISRWECGICAPDLSVLVCLSRTFGVSLDCIFGLR